MVKLSRIVTFDSNYVPTKFHLIKELANLLNFDKIKSFFLVKYFRVSKVFIPAEKLIFSIYNHNTVFAIWEFKAGSVIQARGI